MKARHFGAEVQFSLVVGPNKDVEIQHLMLNDIGGTLGITDRSKLHGKVVGGENAVSVEELLQTKLVLGLRRCEHRSLFSLTFTFLSTFLFTIHVI